MPLETFTDTKEKLSVISWHAIALMEFHQFLPFAYDTYPFHQGCY